MISANRPLCIYHGKCADGFTAAWVVNRAFKGEVDFYPGVYGQKPPDVANRNVILVDFSYKRPVLESMLRSGEIKQAWTLLVLDHHKTAAEDLAGLLKPEGCEQEGAYDPSYWRLKWEAEMEWPVRCVFDMERSGAQLTWDFFNPGVSRPPLVDYVGDRDLWSFKLPLSREVNAFVFAHDYTFENWDHLDRQMRDHVDVQRVADMGGAIEKKHHKDVAELVDVTRRTMRIGGRAMPVANIPYTLTSDAGNLMAKHDQGVAACYWDTPAGRVFSLRSTENGPDVSEIAKGYGGGGHKNAAGFQMPRGWEGDA
jgi:oligoribonuclease NrnB/cAMP/cGMP phosphodiesterase (DHH superfamily)